MALKRSSLQGVRGPRSEYQSGFLDSKFRSSNFENDRSGFEIFDC